MLQIMLLFVQEKSERPIHSLIESLKDNLNPDSLFPCCNTPTLLCPLIMNYYIMIFTQSYLSPELPHPIPCS